MNENKLVSIRYDKRAIIRLIPAIICLIFSFTSWFKITNFFEDTVRFSLFNGSLYIDAPLFLIAKILLIVSYLMFLSLLVVTFVDIKKVVKPETLKSVKYLASMYFTTILLSCLLCLIGTIVVTFSKYFHPAYGWYITFIFSIIGLILSTKKFGKKIYRAIGL